MRRFPAPWTLPALDGGFKIVDSHGQSLAYSMRIHSTAKLRKSTARSGTIAAVVNTLAKAGIELGAQAAATDKLACRSDVMKRTWTIIGVRDVPGSFHWYQSLFGQPETSPAHAYFGQILDMDGTVLLCLHEWGAHEHPSLKSPDQATPGNGLLLFFRVDDFGMTLARARALVARLEEEPHVNPNTGTEEFSLRDSDGYYVTVNAISAA